MADNIKHFYDTIGGGDMYSDMSPMPYSQPSSGSDGNMDNMFIALLICFCCIGTVSCISSMAVLPQMKSK